MNAAFKIGIALLLLGLLCACVKAPPESTGDTTAPSTQPAPDFKQLYDMAAEQAMAERNYSALFSLEKSYADGNRSITEQATLQYTVCGAGNADAIYGISSVTFLGEGSVQLRRVYRDGMLYVMGNSGAFSGSMEEAAFTATLLPNALLSSDHYEQITGKASGDGWVITFSQPVAAESWLSAKQPVISAEGNAWLSSEGKLEQITYCVLYDEGATRIALTVTGRITPAQQEALSAALPRIPEETISLQDPEAVAKLLLAAEHIFNAEAIRSETTETVVSDALSLTHSQKTLCAFIKREDRLDAQLDFTVTVAPERGGATVNTRQERYEDGCFTRIINGGAPVQDTRYTWQEVRQYCENTILGGLFPPAFLADARIEAGENTLILHLTGTDVYTGQLMEGIDMRLGVDLDSLSTEKSVSPVTGTVTLDLLTGLPLEFTLSITCSHVIGDVSYPLTYSLQQNLQWNVSLPLAAL